VENYKKHKPKHQSNSKNPPAKYILIFVLFTLLVLFLFLLKNNTPTKFPNDAASSQSEETTNENSIAIPGYEGLTLKADTKKQEISLKNPAENNCYFVITLYLEDGTELWKSDYIKSGDISKPIKLNRKLSAGNYSAKLKYDCFALNKEKTPLNGAEIKLTLRVK